MVVIIDYGMGNIQSVKKALELCGAKVKVSNDPLDMRSAKKLILPGVGAFGDAMQELEKQDLVALIKDEVKNKKPFLGICLGMQLLFEKSEEADKRKGLEIIRGEIKKFPASSLVVPHMGWNQLSQKEKNCPLLKDIADNSYVYFCHSYYAQPKDEGLVAATTGYGVNFASVVWQDNIYGAQFHPEKSQGVGLKMLENFVHLC